MPNWTAKTVYSDSIFYYEGIVKDTQRLVEAIESEQGLTESSLISTWHDWKASDSSEFQFGMRKMTNESAYDQASESSKLVFDTIRAALEETSKDYCESLSIPSGKQAPISISKYFVDAFMGPHTDSSPEPTIEHISSVLYLNDDYEGGEIHFPNQGVFIKPKAGSIVVFPSVPPFTHESKRIVRGTKYMSPGFWSIID